MTDHPFQPAFNTRIWALGAALLPGGYLLLTSTATLNETLWQYDVKRILELFLLPLIIGVVLLSKPLRVGFQRQLTRIPGWMAAAIGMLLVLGVLSSAYNRQSILSLLYSLAEVSLLSLLALAALCIAACRQAAGTLFDQVAILLLAMVAVTVGLQELLGVLAAWNSGMEFHPRIALLHFSWPRFYNQVQTWSIPAITALPLVFPGKPLARLLCAIALAFEWYVVIVTGGRGTMAAVSLAIFAAIVFLPGIRKTLIIYQLAGLMGGLAIYMLVLIGHQNLQLAEFGASVAPDRTLQAERPAHNPAANSAAIQKSADSSGNFLEPVTGARIWTSSGRLGLWRDSLGDVRSHPLLGIGPMNYACSGPIYRAAHPHNFLLQLAGEWGIPALLLLLLLVSFMAVKLVRRLRPPEKNRKDVPPPADFLAIALLAASIHACLSGVLVMPASQVAGILVCGWLLGILPIPAAVRPANLSGTLVLAAGLSLCIALLVFARHELAVAEVRFGQTPQMDRGIPRLWQNGKVCRLYRNAGSDPAYTP